MTLESVERSPPRAELLLGTRSLLERLVALGARGRDVGCRRLTNPFDDLIGRVGQIPPEPRGALDKLADERVGQGGPRSVLALEVDRAQMLGDGGEAAGVAELLAHGAHRRCQACGDQRVMHGLHGFSGDSSTAHLCCFH